MDEAKRVHERIDAVFPSAYRRYLFQTTLREGGTEWSLEIWDRKGQLLLRCGPKSDIDALLDAVVPGPAVPDPVTGPARAHA